MWLSIISKNQGQFPDLYTPPTPDSFLQWLARSFQEDNLTVNIRAPSGHVEPCKTSLTADHNVLAISARRSSGL